MRDFVINKSIRNILPKEFIMGMSKSIKTMNFLSLHAKIFIVENNARDVIMCSYLHDIRNYGRAI